MYSIHIKEANGFHQYILSDGDGTEAAVLPACGGILHAFSVPYQGEKLNIIDGYDNAEAFVKNVAGLGFKGCKLSPFACRMRNGEYHFGQEQYKVHGFYLGDHALHGLLYNAVYSITDQKATEEKAVLKLLHQYRGSDPGYPFAYDCVITYTLEHHHRLTISTIITNQSDMLMPIQDGWHPYFTFGDSINHCQLEFQSKDIVMFDNELLPTGGLKHYEEFGSLTLLGDTVFDNCFTVNFAECQPLCVLRDPKKRVEIEIYPDRSYPYLQIYTPDHRKSIAIENLSAAPDAFNNAMGLKTLSAGEAATFTTMYKITVLPAQQH